MKIIDIIKTANTNLFRSKLRTFLTMLAIFVGALTLTLTAGLGAGVKDYISKQTDSVSMKDSLTILPSAFGMPSDFNGVSEYNPDKEVTITNVFLTQNDMDRIKKVEKITDAKLLFLPKPEYITRENSKKFRDEMIDVNVKNLKMPLAAGEMPNKDNEILLAYKFVEALGFRDSSDAVGKEVEYAFKNQKNEIKTVKVKIAGVQLNNLAGSQNRISEKLAEDMFRYQFGNIEASQYAMAYIEPNLSKDSVDKLKKDLKDIGYNAQTFEDQINNVKDVFNYLQIIVNAFGVVVILAASIGVINTLLMAVYERTREIGLMKALGMRGKDVFKLFAFEAASLGFWGGLSGSIVAVVTGMILNKVAANGFLKGFEGFTLFIFTPKNLLIVVLGTLLVGLLAGTLPAIKASRLNPIDALRYE